MSIENRLKKPLGDWPKTLDKQIQTVLATPSASPAARAEVAIGLIRDRIEKEQAA